MRTFIAALLGATAVLPALVHATPIGPDPADSAASVPAVNVPSAFVGYRPFREQQAPTWQALNRAVASSSDEPGMEHGQMHSGDETNGGSNHGAHHEEPAK
ncbi:hypothetical protein PQR05_12365 [Paraburkholderia sediminicola]|uniref:hypothetical protein n=1 Tax=Paraburkholderia TaxID=1822464 RepID=UPI0038B8D5B5